MDWNNKNTLISKHFTVKEALLLRSWGIYHTPSDEEKKNILVTAQKMDLIRDFFGVPIRVNCWIRPIRVNCPESKYNGQNYNAYVGSRATKSAHISGKACDFVIFTFEGIGGCNRARKILCNSLSSWEIRMEDIEGNWIHIDTAPVGASGLRFFKP